MATTLHVRDVALEDFEEAVIEESKKRPVAVDFWAAWCGPCRVLGPLLEKLAAEFRGDFLLAKIDTEANPELAETFHIRSIPNVKIFKDGEVVDELVGAVSESEARRFLRRHCPSEADQRHAEGMVLLDQNRLDEARARLEGALTLEPAHAPALLELGRVLALQGKSEQAAELWDRIPAASPLWEKAQTLKQAAEFSRVCSQSGGPEASSARLAANPADLEARYAHACCLVALERHREALTEFLAIVARNKTFRDQSARKAMLTIFAIVGERSELAEEYRKKLAQVLF